MKAGLDVGSGLHATQEPTLEVLSNLPGPEGPGLRLWASLAVVLAAASTLACGRQGRGA